MLRAVFLSDTALFVRKNNEGWDGNAVVSKRFTGNSVTIIFRPK